MKQISKLPSFVLSAFWSGIAFPARRSFRSAVYAMLLAFSACHAAALDVVYVMRHAQKDETWKGKDEYKPLTEKGALCAELRADWLGEKGIVAVYAVEMVRTIATGMAVSFPSSEIKIVGNDEVRDPTFAEMLRSRHKSMPGKQTAVLVVGQSTDIRSLVSAFTDKTKCLDDPNMKLPKKLPSDQYGDLWVLELDILDLDEPGCRGIFREKPLPLNPNKSDKPKHSCGAPG